MGYARSRWVSSVLATLVAASLLSGILYLVRKTSFAPANSVQQLAELPVGHRATLLGVVTYADRVAHRFWLEDATGAVLVSSDPKQYGLLGGETITLTGVKTHPYEPSQGPTSVGLEKIKVTVERTELKLPPPLAASVRNLPENEKRGRRILLTGILRRVSRDSEGRTELAIAETGPEITATLPSADNRLPQWVDGKVSATGIAEETRSGEGVLLSRRLWVRDSSDIQLQERPPATPAVFSIRDLYAHLDSISGHRLSLRARVAGSLSPTSLLLEDSWAAVRCSFSEPPRIQSGAAIEVSGFPGYDGLRLDLSECSLKPIADELIAGSTSKADEQSPISTAAGVRNLTESQARQALPVRLRGVITYNDPIWNQLYFQDATSGIYAKYAGTSEELKAGDEVIVTGLTNPGNFAPVVIAPKFQVLRHGRVIPPASVDPRDAASGILDSRYVQIEGVVHPIKENQEPDHITFELHSPIGQVHVYTSRIFTRAAKLRELEDATIRLRGVFGTVFNSRRQIVGYQLSTSSPPDVEILEPPVQDPFALPPTPIADLLRFAPHARTGHRVKVTGSVTMLGHDRLYLQDATGGLEVHIVARDLRLGQTIEAVGYATAGPYSPILSDAQVRPHGVDHPIAPVPSSPDTLLRGQYDSQLVSLDGTLLAVVDIPTGKDLLLQSGLVTFHAQLDTSEAPVPTAYLQPGATLRITGVCSAQVDPDHLYFLLFQPPVGFTILLRSPADITVLRPAPWWTPQRTLTAVALLTVVMIVTLGWVTALRRRIHLQRDALRKAAETTQAITDLATAMNDVTNQQDFSARVSVRGSEPIAGLVVHFNQMLCELQHRDHAEKEAERKLQQQALTDELTGLPNRRLLSDRLEQILARARRDSCMVALLYIDLDGFKLVNDSLGHPVGDLLLREVADRLRSKIRQSDTLARLGGDEFTVILSKVTHAEDAELVANVLLQALSARFLIAGQEITIGASIGVSLFPKNGGDAYELLQHADSAMYAAKRNGKNQVKSFTDDLGTLVRERLTLENQLRAALANGEISLHYQPEFDLLSNNVVRFEALARWTHPTLGNIPPSKFIPVAEESGLIIPLGEYILEAACREALSWQSVAGRPVQVAVNVSNLQFARDSFVDDVLAVLQRTQLKPELLQLELTESAMIAGTDRLSDVINKLRTAGISFAIDDFGTGYSSLSYLPRLPFDALKIDRSFITDIASRSDTKAMVQSLVTLAHNFGMRVIVEGIETEEQLKAVREMGTNDVQGYLVGRPTSDPMQHLVASAVSEAKQTPAEVKSPISKGAAKS